MSNIPRSQITELITRDMISKLRTRGMVLPEIQFAWGRLDLLCLIGLFPWELRDEKPFALWGIEIKSCKQDFLSDDKWWRYLASKQLDKFTFACPEDAISLTDIEMRFEKNILLKNKVAQRVGLYHYNPAWLEYQINGGEFKWDEKWYRRSSRLIRNARRLELGEDKEVIDCQREDLKRTILYRAVDYYFRDHRCHQCQKSFAPWASDRDLFLEDTQ